jgi:hypothetical protein
VVGDEILGAFSDPGEIADAELVPFTKRGYEREPRRVGEHTCAGGSALSVRRVQAVLAQRFRTVKIETEKVAAVVRQTVILTSVDTFRLGRTGYPRCVSLQRLRGRMPLIAFILLAIVCLALWGLACACLSGEPMQALDRALSTGQALPPLIELWAVAFAALIGASFFLAVRTRAASRASPAILQRFLL